MKATFEKPQVNILTPEQAKGKMFTYLFARDTVIGVVNNLGKFVIIYSDAKDSPTIGESWNYDDPKQYSIFEGKLILEND